jgi:hypothetical protein
MRRVNCTLRNFRENNEEPKEWKIYRMEGINENCSTKAMDYITSNM